MTLPLPVRVAQATPAYFMQMAHLALSHMFGLCSDPDATVDDLRRISAEVREPGQCWALADEVQRPGRALLLELFSGWLDLEHAFLAGEKLVTDCRAEEAAFEATEAADAAEADAHLDDRISDLKASVPGLADWCRANPRAAHSCCWFLFNVQPRRLQLALLNYLVRERVSVVPDGDCAYVLSCAAGVVRVEGVTLQAAVRSLRDAIAGRAVAVASIAETRRQ